MGDHKEVFRSLQELFPQVDHRILKAIAIEHNKDVDSAVVAVLDEVMPSMTDSVGALSAHHEAIPFTADSARNLFANSTREVGSSSSAEHDTHVDEADRNVHSAHHTSSVDVETATKENVDSKSYVDGLTQMSNHDHVPSFDVVYANLSAKSELANSDNESGCDGYPSSVGANDVSSGAMSNEKDALASLPDVPMQDTEGSSVGVSTCKEQKDTSHTDAGYNGQPSGDVVEDGDILLSSRTDMLPDLNLNHFASTTSTHSSHSVSTGSLEDSIAGARSNKNDLLPSLEMVTKMIEDVELLEEKAKVAKHESSVAGNDILTKVEKLKEMLTHAKEANDMHACEVFGEKSVLTTEARELQSRIQRLSDERDRYLAVIEEVRQTLEERLVAAQREIAAAEKEKIEKEAAAQALLDEQEKMMNSIVEESRRLQKEAEDNLKLKEFLVERGEIVDMLQGEMAVICEDVSLLKQVVDERLSLSKLQRSTMSSLSSSSLHKSGNSSDRTIEAVESTDKHTIAEAACPVGEDLDGNDRTVEVPDGDVPADRGTSKRQDSNSNEEGWDFVDDVQEE
ncbi:hypothetical protein QOZ80_5BG0420720 [Eleusine coracana subsp. coracana]|nr:hypothetical protein QOZ80_5BG0420720 [Eleusine coracana subsp. coracana]